MKFKRFFPLFLTSFLTISLSSCKSSSNSNNSNKDNSSENGTTYSEGNVTTDEGSEPYIPQEGDIDAKDINSSTPIADIVANNVFTDNYYSSISSSKTGTQLRDALYDLVKDHTVKSYNTLEDNMRITDRDWKRCPNVDDENPYMILIYYTQNNNSEKQQLWNHYHTSVSKFGVPDDQQSWDKEHIWAKSNGIGSSGAGYSDLHHLRASDRKNNNTRSSLPFGEVTGSKTYVQDFSGTNSGAKGSSNGTSVYEPYSIFKGDVARALLYMAVRYKSTLTLTDGTNSSGGKWGFISTLIKWHLEDPADEFEIKRNSLVQYYQGNRNPFIDKPEYACRIYSSQYSSIKSVCDSH